MIEYQIEKGIPVQPKTFKRNVMPFKYPFNYMEVGDSFLISDYKSNKNGYAFSYVSMPNQRLKPKKFTQRLTIDGVRIWRIK